MNLGLAGSRQVIQPPDQAAFPVQESRGVLGISDKLTAAFTSYLTEDFSRGSEESRRADTYRGEARALGIVLGVTNGRPESRRLAGVGRADTCLVLMGVLVLLTRLCGAATDERLAGVLWTITLEKQNWSLQQT